KRITPVVHQEINFDQSVDNAVQNGTTEQRQKLLYDAFVQQDTAPFEKLLATFPTKIAALELVLAKQEPRLSADQRWLKSYCIVLRNGMLLNPRYLELLPLPDLLQQAAKALTSAPERYKAIQHLPRALLEQTSKGNLAEVKELLRGCNTWSSNHKQDLLQALVTTAVTANQEGIVRYLLL